MVARSLHIGVNELDPGHYAGWVGRLNACELDAESMCQLAEGLGYEATSLLTKDAVRASVLEAVQAAAAASVAGDVFLLSYAGHGGQLPDRNGDEADFIDETWCLFDGELVDDELHVELASFAAGVRVLVVSDSCHSGTVTRAGVNDSGEVELIEEPPVLPARAMPAHVARDTYRAHAAFYDEVQRGLDPHAVSKIAASVRLLSACQDNQTAADGVFNGLFTATLLRVWDEGRYSSSYARFLRDVRMRMPSTQQPNHFVIGARDAAFDAQTPFAV